MAITPTLYDTDTLLGVMQQSEPVSSYWLDLCFNSEVTFDTEFIDFEKLTETRKLAPFVAPSAQGKPIFSEGSTVTRLKPAYVKVKDPVRPDRLIRRAPGNLAPGSANQTPMQRFDAVVGQIAEDHRKAILRRLEWLAARAIIDGRVTLSGEAYPERVVDFQRDSAHTVALTSGTYWTTSSDIIGDLNTWISRVRRAKFGGPVNRATIGAAVWDVMSKNAGFKDQLDTQVRGTNATFKTGLRTGEYVEYVGNIDGLDLYVYSDFYQQDDGSAVPFMSEKDIVLTGPNVMGVRAFGAILDLASQMRPLPIFPKMFNSDDPSVTNILTQSAPLMVPVNPNNTLKATVLA